jgi:hypothetical protein
LIELQRLTGARSGDLVIMRPGDIDRSGETVSAGPRHKSEHRERAAARQVRTDARAQAVLAPFLARPCDQLLFSPRLARALTHIVHRVSAKVLHGGENAWR